MTESRRIGRINERVDLLKRLRRNTKLSHFDLVESHRFLKYWIAAYHLGQIIVKIQDVERYIIIFGPFWDFLKEHDLEISNHRDRRELITNYIHSRHYF